jgi:hypothetical protein
VKFDHTETIDGVPLIPVRWLDCAKIAAGRRSKDKAFGNSIMTSKRRYERAT